MQNKTLLQHVFVALLLGFLSVLSISGTIALRNVLHAFMLGILLWIILFARDRLTVNSMLLARRVPLAIYFWCFFLLAFPLWAEDSPIAWFNLRGQWGLMILTWILAFGVILILGSLSIGLWSLAKINAIPVYIHLGLVLMSWFGLLRPVFYENPTLWSLWLSLKEMAFDPRLWVINVKPFPIGFRGIEPLHFNIGHAANQSIGIAMVCFLRGWGARDVRRMWGSGLLVTACFCSTFIAGSRGAVVFGALLVVGSLIGYSISGWLRGVNRISLKRSGGIIFGGFSILIIFLVLMVSFFNVARNDERWFTMWDKMTLGWLMDNPTNILCKGLSTSDESLLVRQYGERGTAYVDVLKEGLLGQDGGRVLLMRAGKDLALEHPFGLDGSRQAYEKRIEQKCGHPPALAFAHAHHGWINLALSLGWLGAFLFAWVLLSFIATGLRWLGCNQSWPYGLALFLLSSFWLIRGMTDAVYQDHYMQMLAFNLLFIFLIRFEANGANDLTRV